MCNVSLQSVSGGLRFTCRFGEVGSTIFSLRRHRVCAILCNLSVQSFAVNVVDFLGVAWDWLFRLCVHRKTFLVENLLLVGTDLLVLLVCTR